MFLPTVRLAAMAAMVHPTDVRVAGVLVEVRAIFSTAVLLVIPALLELMAARAVLLCRAMPETAAQAARALLES